MNSINRFIYKNQYEILTIEVLSFFTSEYILYHDYQYFVVPFFTMMLFQNSIVTTYLIMLNSACRCDNLYSCKNRCRIQMLYTF